MEKKLNKSKIIILMVVIIMSIMAFFVLYVGLSQGKSYKNNSTSKATVIEGDMTIYDDEYGGIVKYGKYTDGTTKTIIHHVSRSRDENGDYVNVENKKEETDDIYFYYYKDRYGFSYTRILEYTITTIEEIDYEDIWAEKYEYAIEYCYGEIYEYDSEIYCKVQIKSNYGMMLYAYLMNKGKTDVWSSKTTSQSNTTYTYFTLNDKDAILKTDLNMSGISMPAIGTPSNPFKGTFNGKGYKISSLLLCKYTKSNSNYYGLFAYIDSAIIENVHIDNVTWTDTLSDSSGGLWTGILVARGKGNCVIQNILVRRSSISVVVNGRTISSHYDECYIGGLVGLIENSLTVKNCAAVVDLNIKRNYNNYQYQRTIVGGLVGQSTGSVNIQNSYYVGSITTKTYYSYYYGGLIGYTNASSQSNIHGNMVQIKKLDLNNEGYAHEVADYEETYYVSTAISYLNLFANYKTSGSSISMGTNYYSEIELQSISCSHGEVETGWGVIPKKTSVPTQNGILKDKLNN